MRWQGGCGSKVHNYVDRLAYGLVGLRDAMEYMLVFGLRWPHAQLVTCWYLVPVFFSEDEGGALLHLALSWYQLLQHLSSNSRFDTISDNKA